MEYMLPDASRIFRLKKSVSMLPIARLETVYAQSSLLKFVYIIAIKSSEIKRA